MNRALAKAINSRVDTLREDIEKADKEKADLVKELADLQVACTHRHTIVDHPTGETVSALHFIEYDYKEEKCDICDVVLPARANVND